jgi:hypothetical protein
MKILSNKILGGKNLKKNKNEKHSIGVRLSSCIGNIFH